jgi:hypothetical protein
MKIAGWALMGIGISVASASGCAGENEPRQNEPDQVGRVQQSLALVPPINGGMVLVAGTGQRGRQNSLDPTNGTFNDAFAVLPVPSAPPSPDHLALQIGATTPSVGSLRFPELAC